MSVFLDLPFSCSCAIYSVLQDGIFHEFFDLYWVCMYMMCCVGEVFCSAVKAGGQYIVPRMGSAHGAF